MLLTAGTTGLLQKLSALQQQSSSHKALIGFDGYVDLIQKAVQSSAANDREYYHSLNDIGEHIAAAAGKSAQIELRTITTKLGGNAPIMANALAQLGTANYCVGTMGYPQLHEVFQQMHHRCTVLSVGEPAKTNALEFEDGKLILSELGTFEQFDLNSILRLKGKDFLDKPLKESKLIAMVDWTNLPHCTQLWKQMHAHVNQLGLTEKIYFFDLCDPSKKTNLEIREVLQVISRFTELGTTILGLNENEALKVYYALHGVNPLDGEHIAAIHTDDLTAVTQFIFNYVKTDAVVVHPVDRSLLVTKKGVITLPGKVVSHPKILTGGGDNLNAGFCFGLLNHFSLEESVLLGMATSGAYVQNGCSPTVSDLITYIEAL